MPPELRLPPRNRFGSQAGTPRARVTLRGENYSADQTVVAVFAGAAGAGAAAVTVTVLEVVTAAGLLGADLAATGLVTTGGTATGLAGAGAAGLSRRTTPLSSSKYTPSCPAPPGIMERVRATSSLVDS